MAEKPTKVYEAYASKRGYLQVRASSKAEARRLLDAGKGVPTREQRWVPEVSSIREKS